MVNTIKELRHEALPSAEQPLSSPRQIADIVLNYCEKVAQGQDLDIMSISASVEEAEAELAIWNWGDTQGRITPEYAEVRKDVILEIANSLRSTRQSEEDPNKPKTTALAAAFSHSFLGISPNITDYVGETQDSLQVLRALASVPELASAYHTKCHGLAYDLAFDPNCGDIVGKLLDDRSTLGQLEGLRVLRDITSVMQYSAGYDSAEDGAVRIADKMWEYISDDKIKTWMPQAVALSSVNRINLGEAPLDSIEGIAPEIIEEEKEYARGKHFSGDWAKFRPIQLAPGMIGARSAYGIIEGAALVDKNRVDSNIFDGLPLRDIFAMCGVEVSDEEVELFQELRSPGIQGYLEWQLGGVNLGDIDLAAQLKLVNYIGTRPAEDFNRVTKVSSDLSDGDGRTSFLEAFLATEFGEDYGDAILDIAEHASPEQSAHIFETIRSLRTRTGEFAKMFQAIDPKLANATERALNGRITDALTSLQEVAVRGSLHEDVAPHQKKADYIYDGRFDIGVGSMGEAIEILDGLEKTFGLMHDIIDAKDIKITKVNNGENQFVLYRLMSGAIGNMMVYIRPEGAYGYDKNIEHGNRKGVEASISFMVDPIDPHKLLMPKDPSAVSIRFDHEGRLVDEPPDSDKRDPTRKDGLISVDVSSGVGRSDSLPVQIGRFIAAGNRIRAQREGTEDSLHHNTNYFNQDKYGDSDGFAWLARGVIRQFELLRRATNYKRLGKFTSGVFNNKTGASVDEWSELEEAA